MKGGTMQRLCAACRTYHLKTDLIRIMKTDHGYVIDPGRKIHGRSVYVCRSASCVDTVLKRRSLGKHFREPVPESVYEALSEVRPHE